MGVFRGITADEESVAGIFRALQARQYPSGRLKTGLDFGYLEQALETLSWILGDGLALSHVLAA